MNRPTSWLFGTDAMGRALVAGALATVLMIPAASAQQGKEMSDNSVRSLMNYAWVITPPKFTGGGKEIVVDKTKPDQAMIPLDVAREVIRVGRLSASAQMCGLAEQQVANYQTMIKREQAKNKWTDQQMVYINTLHLFTVMLMTGGVKIIENETDKDGKDVGKSVVIENAKLAQPKSDACSDAESKKVGEQINAYIASAEPKKN
jgi:hypothetical protein